MVEVDHALAMREASNKIASKARCVVVLCCILAFASTGCAINRRPLVLPSAEKPYVAVMSGEMPEPITIVSRHAWIVVNPGNTRNPQLLRYELLGHGTRRTTLDPFDYFGEGDVALHGVVVSDKSAIEALIVCLDFETPQYNKEHPTYFPIPGPNSNTFVDQLLRRCKIPIDLPPTAIGKDYRGILGASRTSGGTGIQLETWLAGIKIGLKEGVELHFLGFTVGVDFWPPAFLLPVNPGRLGFDDR